MTPPSPDRLSIVPPLLLLYAAVTTAVWVVGPGFEIAKETLGLETAQAIDRGLAVSCVAAPILAMILSVRSERRRS